MRLIKTISSCTLLLISSLAFAQTNVDLELSARHNFTKKPIVDELPPSIFLKLSTNNARLLRFGIEGFYDIGYQRSEWPGIGDYSKVSETFGYGFQFEIGTEQWKNIGLQFKSGFGVMSTSNRLNTNRPILKEYIALPKNEDKAYLYASIGIEYQVGPRNFITADGGVGLNQISIGFKTRIYEN